MNEYNIKVGDYVETWDGDIGVIKSIAYKSFACEFTFVSDLNDYVKNVGYWFLNDSTDISKLFKQIGVNNFSKKEIKFESICKLDATWDTKSNVQNELIKYGYIKINELIDHINAIQERLNEYDSTRID